MTQEHHPSEAKGPGLAEAVTVTVELHRHGAAVETITIECEGEPSHRHLAEKLAAVLSLGAEELLAEFAHEQGAYDQKKRHGKLKLDCVDVHFESESVTHHFPAHATWKHVFVWACNKFRIAKDAAANLELRDGSPEGVVINEAKHLGRFEGCRTVWLVKPGPEPNGR